MDVASSDASRHDGVVVGMSHPVTLNGCIEVSENARGSVSFHSALADSSIDSLVDNHEAISISLVL